jgi:hypothetical protein
MQPPVNGGPDALYELRCSVYAKFPPTIQWTLREITNYTCPHCQWRGLTRPPKVAK